MTPNPRSQKCNIFLLSFRLKENKFWNDYSSSSLNESKEESKMEPPARAINNTRKIKSNSEIQGVRNYQPSRNKDERSGHTSLRATFEKPGPKPTVFVTEENPVNFRNRTYNRRLPNQ